MEASRQRLAGYRRAAAGRTRVRRQPVRQTNWQFSESFTATTSLELAERPDAIFCASDWLAIGCYQALAVNGVRIPQDMLLAGYDDQKISEQLTPPRPVSSCPTASWDGWRWSTCVIRKMPPRT